MWFIKFILLFLSIFGFGMYVNQLLMMVFRIAIYKEDYNKTIGISVLIALLVASLSLALYLAIF